MTDNVILQHEDGENYRASSVSVRYDGRVRDLRVDEVGQVHASNDKEVEQLTEVHGSYIRVDEDSGGAGYVLEDKSVDEVAEYVRDIDSLQRLKELRDLENDGRGRKTAREHIDSRIQEVKGYDDEGQGDGE